MTTKKSKKPVSKKPAKKAATKKTPGVKVKAFKQNQKVLHSALEKIRSMLWYDTKLTPDERSAINIAFQLSCVATKAPHYIHGYGLFKS